MQNTYAPVLFESPYSGDIEGNVLYAWECAQTIYVRRMGPVATHLLWTKLDANQIPGEKHVPDGVNDLNGREFALAAGDAIAKTFDKVIFFTDRGWSSGMEHRHTYCVANNIAMLITTLEKFKDIPKDEPVVFTRANGEVAKVFYRL